MDCTEASITFRKRCTANPSVSHHHHGSLPETSCPINSARLTLRHLDLCTKECEHILPVEESKTEMKESLQRNQVLGAGSSASRKSYFTHQAHSSVACLARAGWPCWNSFQRLDHTFAAKSLNSVRLGGTIRSLTQESTSDHDSQGTNSRRPNPRRSPGVSI